MRLYLVGKVIQLESQLQPDVILEKMSQENDSRVESTVFVGLEN